MRRAGRLGIAAFGAALVLWASTAAAQAKVDSKVRDRALAVGEAALALETKGDWEGALAKFDEADGLVPFPTFGVRAARCLAKLGRVAEAADRYLKVAEMEPDPTWPDVVLSAQRDATVERNALLPRLGTVVVEVKNAPAADVVITVNHREVPTATATSGVLVDPGQTHVVGTRGADRAESTLRIAAQDKQTVTLAFGAPPPAAPPPVPQAPPPNWKRTAGFVGIGVGGAGFLIGLITGVMAMGKEGDLEKACPDRKCLPNAWEDNDSYGTLKTVSSVGFFGGVIVAGAGVYLLLTSGPAPAKSTASVHGFVGPASAGIGGRF